MPKRLLAKKSRKNKPLGGLTAAHQPHKIRQRSNASTNPERVVLPNKRPHSVRDKPTIKRLNLYNEKPDPIQRAKRPDKPATIEPDRRWFGNTRIVTQKELDTFRTEVREAVHNPYSVLLSRTQLPMSLIDETTFTERKPPLLNIEPYENTFGPKARRKRPKLSEMELSDIVSRTMERDEGYEESKDSNIKVEPEAKDLVRDKRLEAGQSRRIWEELYKVLDSSDVVCQVIDVRDPIGTRCPHVEAQLKKQPHKHMVLILNKCDLVPTWVTTGWVKTLSKEYPTVAFKSSITNPFGKGTFIQLLRQFDKLHKDKKSISIGFIGYPNVGKSSVINTLRNKAVCKVAPVPGETKVWQYITLTKRIYLIDCPGVVYDIGDTEDDLVLKGVIRPEKLDDATVYIEALLKRVKTEHMSNIYEVDTWTDAEDFMTTIAQKQGRLLKGGEPDLNTIAKNLLHDWLTGKIPYFALPPRQEEAALVST
jgi:nuclear GTP-binding protein